MFVPPWSCLSIMCPLGPGVYRSCTLDSSIIHMIKLVRFMDAKILKS